MQAKREKNHNNSNHAPISTFTHNKIRPLPPVLAAPRPIEITGMKATENVRAMRNSKKRSRPAGLLLFLLFRIALTFSVAFMPVISMGRGAARTGGSGRILL